MGRVITISAFSDNYIYLYRYDEDKAFAIDPADSSAVLGVLKANEAASARRPTVLSTIGQERLSNPFLRADCSQIRQALNMTKSEPHDVFAELRRRKDIF